MARISRSARAAGLSDRCVISPSSRSVRSPDGRSPDGSSSSSPAGGSFLPAGGSASPAFSGSAPAGRSPGGGDPSATAAPSPGGEPRSPGGGRTSRGWSAGAACPPPGGKKLSQASERSSPVTVARREIDRQGAVHRRHPEGRRGCRRLIRRIDRRQLGRADRMVQIHQLLDLLLHLQPPERVCQGVCQGTPFVSLFPKQKTRRRANVPNLSSFPPVKRRVLVAGSYRLATFPPERRTSHSPHTGGGFKAAG
eukprot:1186518-Prorocentrum_minimum.AAC.2